MVVVEIRAFRNAWKVKLDEENNHISCLNFVYLSILIIDISSPQFSCNYKRILLCFISSGYYDCKEGTPI